MIEDQNKQKYQADFLVTVEELFAYFFGIYIKVGYNNPSILTPFDSVDVATYRMVASRSTSQ